LIRDASVERIVSVVRALGPLAREITFIGGAIAPLLRTDHTIPRSRPTKDVDAIVASRGHRDDGRFSEALRARGFTHVTGMRAHAHRWRSEEGILADFVPAGDHAGASGSRWDVLAIESAVTVVVDGAAVRHASAAAFLALKLDAFNDRGGGDVLASHDVEDVVALIASRASIVADISASHAEIRARVQRFARAVIDAGIVDDILAAHLNNAEDRAWAIEIARGRIEEMATARS
jgi:hypothetical protein